MISSKKVHEKKSRKTKELLLGYEYMKAAETWADGHPGRGIIISRCDDDRFAGSMILFIPAENKYRYMGTNMVVIPQLSGSRPSVMFLYQHHNDGLMTATRLISERTAIKRPKEPIAAHWKLPFKAKM